MIIIAIFVGCVQAGYVLVALTNLGAVAVQCSQSNELPDMYLTAGEVGIIRIINVVY